MLRLFLPTLCLLAVPALADHHSHDEHAAGHHGDHDSDGHHGHDDGFEPLFDGATIDGWVQRGGKAIYTVAPDAVGGAQIVGTSVANTGNSFLSTGRNYGDFILELEVKVDPILNSGIQFRSLQFDEKKPYTTADGKTVTVNAGRVHGYQAEIDPSDRAWSAGIYDEGRRGWIFNLEGEEHAAARAAFDRYGWNKYRIEAIGNRIKTYVNGVPAADFEDDMTAEGFIALQVHGVGRKEQVGKQIRWRNIRIKEVSN